MKQGEFIMNYKIIDKENYYRKGVYRHFTQDCKCYLHDRPDRRDSPGGVQQTDGHQILSQLSVHPVEGAQLPGRLPDGVSVADG